MEGLFDGVEEFLSLVRPRWEVLALLLALGDSQEFPEDFLRGISQGMLSPRYPEPVFTPACTAFSVYFQRFSVVVTDEVLKTFPSHLFSDDFFPLPVSWCGSGGVVQLGVRIRDCSLK